MSDKIHKISENNYWQKGSKELSDEFNRAEGRRPRILVGNYFSDPALSSNKLCNQLSDVGFDVDIAPTLVSFESLVNQSIENDTDIILICSDRDVIEEDLLTFQQLLLLQQPDMILSVCLRGVFSLKGQREKLKKWLIFDDKASEKKIAYELLHRLMSTS